MRLHQIILIVLAIVLLPLPAAHAQSVRHVLLLGMKRDHPQGRHEYMAGLRVLEKCLVDVPEIKTEVVAADEPWPDGPELLKKADAVVLYLGQGAKWMQADPQRMAALKDLARRGGGIVALHSGIMSTDAKDIDLFRDLVGGCHGGPDRRYIVMDADLRVTDRSHPITMGVADVRIHDEFYFKLKFARQGKLQPILQLPIEGKAETVAWAYERPDGGRSVGFSGMDPHANWRVPSYRRLAAQAVLWTLKLPVPHDGLPVNVPEALLQEPELTTNPKPMSPVGTGYRLAWSDEFDGSKLDEKKWIYRVDTRFWSAQQAKNVSVANGCLRISLKKEKSGKSDYTAGGVISRQTFQYGYYEARFRCPPGAGWHTSFWMMRSNWKHTAAAADAVQEIDVCEQDSVNLKRYEVNLHRWKPEPHLGLGHKRVATPDLTADFHVWGCEFTPRKIDYYFDGKLVQSIDATALPHGPQNIWLTSIAAPLGGTKAVDDSRLPCVAEFDYVRYFAPSDQHQGSSR